MKNDLQFKYKYLKYKLKYLKLNKQYGGDDFPIKLINNDTKEEQEFDLDEHDYSWQSIKIELKIPSNVQVYYLDKEGKKKIIKDDKTYGTAYAAGFTYDYDAGVSKLYYEIPQETKVKEEAEVRKRKDAEKLASAHALAVSKEKVETETKDLIKNIQLSFDAYQRYNTKIKTTNPPAKKGIIKNIFPNVFVDITDVEINFSSTQHRLDHESRQGERGHESLKKGHFKWITVNLHLDDKNNIWVYQVSIFNYVNTLGNKHNFQKYVFTVDRPLGDVIPYVENPDETLSSVTRSKFTREQILDLLNASFTAITTSMSTHIIIAK